MNSPSPSNLKENFNKEDFVRETRERERERIFEVRLKSFPPISSVTIALIRIFS